MCNGDSAHGRVICNRNATLCRFRRLLAVEYGKGRATFVVFDTEMSKLTKTKAATLALEEV